jgi:serine/threonine-protein kinase
MIDQLIGQTLEGKYRIEERLREDNFARTYRATHRLMDKSVAVKVLNPALATDANVVADFEREAKLLSRLAHPHVLSVTDFGADAANGVHFLVMENFDGKTLKNLIGEQNGLSLERATNIVQQISSALFAAHQNGIVHGGLGSNSVLLENNAGRDWVKVVDFDAAENALNPNSLPANPEDVAYLAPEQSAESGETDARSDIYALGVILYEMLTGRLPFIGATAAEVIQKHQQEIPPSLLALRSELPPALEQIVQRALAKNPAQRFQTATDFVEALAQTSENVPLASWREPEAIRPNPNAENGTANDGKWRTAFIVLAGISLLSAGLFFFTQGKRTNPDTILNDPNAQPVQPINPATGSPEQDLANLQMIPLSNTDPNSNFNGIPGQPGVVPDIPYGGRIPPGLPLGNYAVDPNSPFTTDTYNVTIQNTNRPATNSAINANVNNKNANVNPANSNLANTKPTNNATPAPTVAPTVAPTPKTAPTNKPAVKPTAQTSEKMTGETEQQ